MASFGAKDEDFMMTAAFSLRDSAIILVLLSFSGMMSSMYFTLAVMYGSYDTTPAMRMRFTPWIMAVIVPSGISRTFMTRDTVPYS